MWSEIVSGAGNLLGGVASGYANYLSSKKQMDFQERMSNTSWRRGVKDMRKAGINPMLAVSEGGASSPSGAGFSVGNPVEGAISSAMEARRLRKEIDMTDSQIGVNETQAMKNRADAALSSAQGVKAGVEADVIGSLYDIGTKVLSDWADKPVDKIPGKARSIREQVGEKLYGPGANPIRLKIKGEK